MRLLIGTVIVFFGTLMAAGLVALGAPVVVDFVSVQQAGMGRRAAPGRMYMDAQAAPRAGDAQARR